MEKQNFNTLQNTEKTIGLRGLYGDIFQQNQSSRKIVFNDQLKTQLMQSKQRYYDIDDEESHEGIARHSTSVEDLPTKSQKSKKYYSVNYPYNSKEFGEKYKMQLLESQSKTTFLDTKNLELTQTDFLKTNRLAKQLKNEEVLFQDFRKKKKKKRQAPQIPEVGSVQRLPDGRIFDQDQQTFRSRAITEIGLQPNIGLGITRSESKENVILDEIQESTKNLNLKMINVQSYKHLKAPKLGNNQYSKESIQILENQKTYIEGNDNNDEPTQTTKSPKQTYQSINNLDLEFSALSPSQNKLQNLMINNSIANENSNQAQNLKSPVSPRVPDLTTFSHQNASRAQLLHQLSIQQAKLKDIQIQNPQISKMRSYNQSPQLSNHQSQSVDYETMVNNQITDYQNRLSSKKLINQSSETGPGAHLQDPLLNQTLNEIVRVQMAKTQMFEKQKRQQERIIKKYKQPFKSPEERTLYKSIKRNNGNAQLIKNHYNQLQSIQNFKHFDKIQRYVTSSLGNVYPAHFTYGNRPSKLNYERPPDGQSYYDPQGSQMQHYSDQLSYMDEQERQNMLIMNQSYDQPQFLNQNQKYIKNNNKTTKLDLPSKSVTRQTKNETDPTKYFKVDSGESSQGRSIASAESQVIIEIPLQKQDLGSDIEMSMDKRKDLQNLMTSNFGIQNPSRNNLDSNSKSNIQILDKIPSESIEIGMKSRLNDIELSRGKSSKLKQSRRNSNNIKEQLLNNSTSGGNGDDVINFENLTPVDKNNRRVFNQDQAMQKQRMMLAKLKLKSKLNSGTQLDSDEDFTLYRTGKGNQKIQEPILPKLFSMPNTVKNQTLNPQNMFNSSFNVDPSIQLKQFKAPKLMRNKLDSRKEKAHHKYAPTIDQGFQTRLKQQTLEINLNGQIGHEMLNHSNDFGKIKKQLFSNQNLNPDLPSIQGHGAEWSPKPPSKKDTSPINNNNMTVQVPSLFQFQCDEPKINVIHQQSSKKIIKIENSKRASPKQLKNPSFQQEMQDKDMQRQLSKIGPFSSFETPGSMGMHIQPYQKTPNKPFVYDKNAAKQKDKDIGTNTSFLSGNDLANVIAHDQYKIHQTDHSQNITHDVNELTDNLMTPVLYASGTSSYDEVTQVGHRTGNGLESASPQSSAEHNKMAQKTRRFLSFDAYHMQNDDPNFQGGIRGNNMPQLTILNNTGGPQNHPFILKKSSQSPQYPTPMKFEKSEFPNSISIKKQNKGLKGMKHQKADLQQYLHQMIQFQDSNMTPDNMKNHSQLSKISKKVFNKSNSPQNSSYQSGNGSPANPAGDGENIPKMFNSGIPNTSIKSPMFNDQVTENTVLNEIGSQMGKNSLKNQKLNSMYAGDDSPTISPNPLYHKPSYSKVLPGSKISGKTNQRFFHNQRGQNQTIDKSNRAQNAAIGEPITQHINLDNTLVGRSLQKNKFNQTFGVPFVQSSIHNPKTNLKFQKSQMKFNRSKNSNSPTGSKKILKNVFPNTQINFNTKDNTLSCGPNEQGQLQANQESHSDEPYFPVQPDIINTHPQPGQKNPFIETNRNQLPMINSSMHSSSGKTGYRLNANYQTQNSQFFKKGLLLPPSDRASKMKNIIDGASGDNEPARVITQETHERNTSPLSPKANEMPQKGKSQSKMEEKMPGEPKDELDDLIDSQLNRKEEMTLYQTQPRNTRKRESQKTILSLQTLEVGQASHSQATVEPVGALISNANNDLNFLESNIFKKENFINKNRNNSYNKSKLRRKPSAEITVQVKQTNLENQIDMDMRKSLSNSIGTVEKLRVQEGQHLSQMFVIQSYDLSSQQQNKIVASAASQADNAGKDIESVSKFQTFQFEINPKDLMLKTVADAQGINKITLSKTDHSGSKKNFAGNMTQQNFIFQNQAHSPLSVMPAKVAALRSSRRHLDRNEIDHQNRVIAEMQEDHLKIQGDRLNISSGMNVKEASPNQAKKGSEGKISVNVSKSQANMVLPIPSPSRLSYGFSKMSSQQNFSGKKLYNDQIIHTSNILSQVTSELMQAKLQSSGTKRRNANLIEQSKSDHGKEMNSGEYQIKQQFTMSMTQPNKNLIKISKKETLNLQTGTPKDGNFIGTPIDGENRSSLHGGKSTTLKRNHPKGAATAFANINTDLTVLSSPVERSDSKFESIQGIGPAISPSTYDAMNDRENNDKVEQLNNKQTRFVVLKTEMSSQANILESGKDDEVESLKNNEGVVSK